MWDLIEWVDNDGSGDLSFCDDIVMNITGTNTQRRFHVEHVATSLTASQRSVICDYDPSCPFYGVEPIIDLAGFPHPERSMCPWHNKSVAVSIPHVVENATFTPKVVYPVAFFNFSPTMPVQCETVTFNASESYHPLSDSERWIANYTWDFDDGSPIIVETEPVTTHLFLEPGTYNVTLTVTDNVGLTASFSRTITVSRFAGELKVKIDAGSIYFPGEKAEFYILIAHLGYNVNATHLNAVLYFNGTFYEDLSPLLQLVDTGVYIITYPISPDAMSGIYELHVKAEYFNIYGTDIKGFQLSSTLTGELVGIKEDIGTIKTDVGYIYLNLTAINSTLVDVQGTVAVINSTLGIFEAKLDAINATLVDVAKLDAINATLVDVIVDAEGGILAKIDTALGSITTRLTDINATVTIVQGDTYTINNVLGEVQDSLGAVQSTLTIGIAAASILSAIAAIAAIILLLKKRS